MGQLSNFKSSVGRNPEDKDAAKGYHKKYIEARVPGLKRPRESLVQTEASNVAVKTAT